MSGPYIQRAKIISGFPGIGKSHFCNPTNPIADLPASFGGFPAIDLETVTFKFNADGKTQKPEWPENFISYVRDRASRPGVLMVPQHQIVCGGLVNNGLAFANVYPLAELKAEYMERYRARGSPQGFLTHMDKNWDQYVTNQQVLRHCDHIMLEKNQYLADRIHEVMGDYDYKTAASTMPSGVAKNSVLVNGPFGAIGPNGVPITIYPSPGTTITFGEGGSVPSGAKSKLAEWPLVLITHGFGLIFSLLLLAFLTIYVLLITHPESKKSGHGI